MFRQAWGWLHARNEPIAVGLAVTLFGLTLLASRANRDCGNLADGRAVAADLAVNPHLYDAPSDPHYYRDQWAAETAAFYASHPVPGTVLPARSATTVPARLASHATAVPSSAAVPATLPAPSSVTSPAIVSRNSTAAAVTAAGSHRTPSAWAVGGCLLAGTVATAVFLWMWPAGQLPYADLSAATAGSGNAADQVDGKWVDGNSADRARADAVPLVQWQPALGGTYALTIPRQWVSIRPTTGQSLRGGVVACGYCLAAVSSWNLLGL